MTRPAASRGPEQAILRMVGELVMPDGKRFREVAEAWQWERIHRPLSARTPEGLPVHPLAYIQIGKGGDKTSGGSRQIVAEAAVLPGTAAYSLAGDTDQAEILLDIGFEYCQRTPALRRVTRRLKDRIAFDNRSFIRRMSADDYTAHGLGALGRRFRFFGDEWWNQQDRGLWDAFWTATGKLRDTQGAILSNAGFRTESVCHEIRELCRTGAIPGAYYFETPADFRPGWVAPEWYERMKASLPPPVYARFIENRWVAATGSFVTQAQIARNVDPAHAPQDKGDGSLHVVALDYGRRKDRTALYVLRHLPAGRIEQVYHWVLDPQKEGEILVDVVEAKLDWVAKTFGPAVLVLDPWQMAGVIQRLRLRHQVVEFVFSGRSLQELSANLYNLITAGRLRLYPDPALERELLLIDVRLESYGWRLDHKSGEFSDRVIALGMAALEAVRRGPSCADIWAGAPVEPHKADKINEWVNAAGRRAQSWARSRGWDL